MGIGVGTGVGVGVGEGVAVGMLVGWIATLVGAGETFPIPNDVNKTIGVRISIITMHARRIIIIAGFDSERDPFFLPGDG